MRAAPVLRTERLELRRPQRGDLAGLVELVRSDETRRFLGKAQPTEAAQFERLMRNIGGWATYGYGNFTVRLHGDDALMGNCGVFHSWRGFGKGMDDVAEAGWIIRRDHCGKGIAQEAMQAALAWFDTTHGPRRITAMIEVGNTASHKLASRLGFLAYAEHVFEGAPLVLYERVCA